MNAIVYKAGQVPSIRSSQGGGKGDGRTDETEKVIRSFRGILNKLTPENYDSLMNQVDQLNVDTEETLKAVVGLIVSKALSEQSYSSTYARMCYHLKGLRVSSSSSDDFVYFQSLLLTRCRVEFKNRGLLPEKENDADDAHEELEQTRRKIRMRLLGTVRFIGELFKLQMISEGIIHTCVGKLLQDESEEHLECMCKLLSTVGKDLDTGTERPKLDSYCDNISQLVKEQKTSSRIRFMLQDVLALRKNNWVPRRRDEGPKPIQQLHQEVKQAEEREMLQLKRITSMRQRGGGRPADRGQNLNVKETPEKLNQGSCEGERNQGSQLGSSSCQGVSKIPVEHKTPPKGGSLSKPSWLCDAGEVYTALKGLLQEKSSNDKIEEWIQNTLNDKQRSSVGFVRALMRAVCQSVIVDCGVYTLNTYELFQRVSLLRKYITDDYKQLVALNVLQQLVVHIDQPDGLLRMFFDVLVDEEVILDENFLKWKSSTVNVSSLTNFFTWLEEANRRIK